MTALKGASGCFSDKAWDFRQIPAKVHTKVWVFLEFLLWYRGIGGISGALGCRFKSQPNTVD